LIAVVLATVAAGAGAAELSSRRAYDLIAQLFSDDASVRRAARDTLIAAADRSLAPALLEVMFFSRAGRPDAAAVLETLLGERHGTSYKLWIEAIGRREEIVPKKGYAAFKASQYARIDPAFAAFFREAAPRTIRLEEVVSGGVRKDGIPSLENPRVIPAARAEYLTEDETVFGVRSGGVARAYPQRILDWHEMVNDRIAGRHVSLAYCTLCGSPILYETAIGPGEVYTFGSSGLLYRSNKLMYDRQTNSLWSHLTGEPVIGPLVGKGKKLRVLPMTITTWREWRTRHPGTEVLSLDTGHMRDYRPGAAYGAYFASEGTMFPVWKRSAALEAKEWIYVVETAKGRKIYPLQALVARPLLTDSIRGDAVLILTDPKSESVRAYAIGSRRFTRDGDALVDSSAGERFMTEEEALVSPGGTRLERLPAVRAYWFGWYGIHPGTEIYRSE
ncbi:MAG TPA: DUF3179 domain-containing protein, partial [Thermoanaerobaculia bacterium]|nr:DUF3179 domain-containing protein [Thermoanaerobaculia bacterium]